MSLFATRSFLRLFLLAGLYSEAAGTIACFVCHSVNGSNPACEDRFNATDFSSLYVKDCKTYKKNHDGLFPADHCIKIDGTNSVKKTTIYIRTCAMDSGSLTADTEIVRMSHCGHFYMGEDYYQGCVQSCDHDGCNASPRSNFHSLSNSVLLSSLFLWLEFHNLLFSVVQ